MGSQSQFHRTGSGPARGLNLRSPLIRSAAVVRFRLWFATVVALSALLATLVRAQVSDEEKRKREESLKTRQEAHDDSSPSDQKSPSPKPKAKHKKSQKSPSPTPKRKKHKPSVEEEETPKPKPSETPEVTSAKSTKSASPSPKPKSKKKSVVKKSATTAKKAHAKAKASPKGEEESESKKPTRAAKAPSPRPSETPMAPPPAALPRAIAVPTATGPPTPISTIPSDTAVEEPAQVTIEKTGYDRPRSFWSRLFGGGGRSSSGAGYRYLTRSVRAEIDRAPADHRNPRWQMVVVHNSGTRQGNARVFDYYHRHVRHMQNGLAYHFVIGNGTSTGNGQIEVGDRWRRQINGGHVHSDNLNNIALGICLVGDFNRDQPTRAQLECCEELIRYLRQRCGKIGSRYMIVRPHREVNPPRWATDCPGDAFPYSWFRRFQE